MGWEKTELSKLNPLGEEEEVGGGGRRRRVEDGDLLVFKGSGRHQSNIKEAHQKTD